MRQGLLHAQQGEWERARQSFEAACETGGSMSAALSNNLGVVAFHQGDFGKSNERFKQAAELWSRDPDDAGIAMARCNLAALYWRQGFFSESEHQLQMAFRILDRKPPNVSPDVLTIEVKPDLNPDNLPETLRRLGPWYQNIEVRPGLMTNPSGGDHPGYRWRILEKFLPKDLAGKTVLDIGCNAGYFSFEMKRRGAARVVSIDIMPHVLAQTRFLSAWFDLPVELRQMDAYDVGNLGEFDYVIFVGVLYHLKHPLYALEKIGAVCRDMMLFQSVIAGPRGDFTPEENYPDGEKKVFEQATYPKLYFVEKSYNGDESNWWFATQSCLKAMLRTAGFREILATENADTFVCHK